MIGEATFFETRFRLDDDHVWRPVAGDPYGMAAVLNNHSQASRPLYRVWMGNPGRWLFQEAVRDVRGKDVVWAPDESKPTTGVH